MHEQFVAHIRALCVLSSIVTLRKGIAGPTGVEHFPSEAGSNKPCQLRHTCGRHLGLDRHLVLVTNNYFEAVGWGLALCRTKDYYWT